MPHAMHRGKSRWALPLLGLLGTVSGTAAAVEPLDRFDFSIGSYVTRFDTQLRADGQAVDGTRFDLRHDLGLDPDDVLAFARLSWRPFERHEFGLSYFNNDVSVEHRLERDIVFEDHVYTAGGTVHASYDLDSIEAYYTWWGFSTPTWALGPRLGVTVYRIDLALDLNLDMNGDPVRNGVLEDTFHGDLPAPTLGASWRWTPAQDWRISADAGWLNTTINRIDGTVAYGRAGVEWHPWSHVGLMLDYNYSDIRASTERRDFTGHLHMRNSGLRLGLIVRY